jgi:hypothetical protein
LWRNQQTEAHLVLRPKPKNRRGDFKAQITKPKLPILSPKLGNPPPPWFWGSTKKSTTGFEAKPGETAATSFEAKLDKTVATGFEAKPVKTVPAGFEAKPLETIATGFEAKPVKTMWVPDLCDHPRSSTPGLLLLQRSSSLHAMPHLPPAHHETSKRDSPNETKIKEKQNETVPNSNSKLSKSMTHHNQTKELITWFLNLPLDGSIDNKSTKFKVRIQDPMKHS